jgi:predicted nucleotidyltransferase
MAYADRVTSEEIAVYRAGGQRRWEQTREGRARRRERAWDAARRAATLLKVRFGATRVVVFGSLLHEDCFTLWSDVDLAAWGIRPEDTFRAIGAVVDSDAEIALNLVDIETARPLLRAAIEREGVEL